MLQNAKTISSSKEAFYCFILKINFWSCQSGLFSIIANNLFLVYSLWKVHVSEEIIRINHIITDYDKQIFKAGHKELR